MVNDEQAVLQGFEILLRWWFEDLTLLSYLDPFEAWQELCRHDPDLLITDDTMPGLPGNEICQRLLERKVMYPIIVNSPWEGTERWVAELASRGLNVSFLPMPFGLEDFRLAVNDAFACCKSMPKPAGRLLPRIVAVDDEDACLKVYKIFVDACFEHSTVLLFSKASEAWQELSRTDPDLLILDTPTPELDLLPILAARKVTYPILVTSGLYEEKHVRQRADPSLKLSFIMKPFLIEQFRAELFRHFDPSDTSAQSGNATLRPSSERECSKAPGSAAWVIEPSS